MSESSAPPVRIPVAVDVAKSEVELIADRLFSAGASAVAEQVRDDGSVTLTADLDVDRIDGFNESTALTLRVVEPDAAWNHGWRDFAKARRCGRIVIRPAWLAADSPVEVDAPESPAPDDTQDVHYRHDPQGTVDLVMEPGTAFGSGTHVTTRLCVEAVDRLVAPGSTALDIGSGTGVLGVAAALLGSGQVVAIDIDDEAVRVTRGLAERNGVAGSVDVSAKPLGEIDGEFDLVLANLLIPAFEELGPRIVERVRTGGRLIASGLLVEHQDRAVAALAGLDLARAESRDGWLLLEFIRSR